MGALHNPLELRCEHDPARIAINLSDKQLKTHEVLQRIRMAWIALWFVLILFSVALLAFLAAIFFLKSEFAAKPILGAVNGILAWITKIVFSYLFPNPERCSTTVAGQGQQAIR
jgi:hypothetical protein